MRPDDELQRAMVLPPQRAFTETFEPRLYCFGRQGFDALAPGAIVSAKLGWEGRAEVGPWEVSPLDGVEPEVAPRKLLEVPPIALPDEPTPAPAADPEPHAAADTPNIALEAPEAVDASSPDDIDIPVTIRNEGGSPVIVRFRPETLGFDLVSPGPRTCSSWPALPTAPTRELFSTLPPRASAELTVQLPAYCGDRVLDHPRLLLVRAWLDTRNASGKPIGLRTFDGRVAATTLTFIRLQRGRLPAAVHPPELDNP
jgi:hypothetical protein